MESKERIAKTIESLRSELVRVGEEKGMAHPLTIKTNQNLDKLINMYIEQKRP